MDRDRNPNGGVGRGRGRGRGRGIGGGGGRSSSGPRGRSSRSSGNSSHDHSGTGTDRKFDSDSFGSKNANFRSRRPTMEQDNSGYEPPPRWQSQQGGKSPDSVCSTSNELDKRSSQIGHTTDTIGTVSHANSLSNNSGYEPAHSGQERESRQGKSSPKSVHYNSKELDISSLQIGHTTGKGTGDCHEISHKAGFASLQEESRLPLKSGINDRPSQSDRPQNGQASLGNPGGNRNTEQSEHSATVAPFDICLNKSGASVMLKPSLLVRNKEKRRETQRSMEGQKGIVLRSGMVLLKNYLSFTDQVKIVKKCRDLGMGFGGFYQPGYGDGAKLHLKMMCLGKNWDPETSMYGACRPIDGAKPPIIPNEFHQLVQRTIQESHAVIGKDTKSSSVEKILPSMSANICIVNFYSETGRLGLHKDRDESAESLRKGLPVVSFSIGYSAEFLYGDDNNIDKAEKIILESGDAILFGGESRHIYHGVTAILPKNAPKALFEETNLRPGRLNLTFREY